jgi:uncharacterized protein
MGRLSSVAAGALLGVALILGGSCSMLGALQRKMTYYPTAGLEVTPAALGLAYEDVTLPTSDGVKLHGWFLPATGAGSTLLFLHGNAGNLGDCLDNVRRLHEIGLNVFIVDYRGYGLSEGKPCEQGLYRDAEAAWAWLLARGNIPQERIVVFGRSLGGAVAVELCSRVPCSRLILESTFTSAADMSRAIFPLFPLGPFLEERYDSLSKIGRVKAALLQFHGTRDQTVPFRLGERLFQAAAGPKEFVPIQGADHNDTYEVAGKEYFEKIRAFAGD